MESTFRPLSAFSRWVLRLWGFRVIGPIPTDAQKKWLLTTAPHTSNWDFVLCVIVRSAVELKVNYVAKESLFKAPHGWFFSWLGGYPVKRAKNQHYVETIADLYRQLDEFRLLIMPEGTRKKVDKFRTGFYYIALSANIPLILFTLDWGNRVVSFAEPFWPTGDVEKDMAFIYSHFRGVRGRVPENSIGV